MRFVTPTLLIAIVSLGACDKPAAPTAKPEPIRVRSAGQDQLFKLDDLNRAIALKRAISATGSQCKRLISSGFVGPYKNMDMWTARCEDSRSAERDWAIFVGANDSVQVRLCQDTVVAGLPACTARAGTEGGSGVAKKK
ncbi:MAG: hypothetical protein LH465_00980 [Sphingomonas bacterium]|nr:hypothetical protein [Sphingomonas bacterium]